MCSPPRVKSPSVTFYPFIPPSLSPTCPLIFLVCCLCLWGCFFVCFSGGVWCLVFNTCVWGNYPRSSAWDRLETRRREDGENRPGSVETLYHRGGRSRKHRALRFRDDEPLTQSAHYWKTHQILWLLLIEFQNCVWSFWGLKYKVTRREKKKQHL